MRNNSVIPQKEYLALEPLGQVCVLNNRYEWSRSVHDGSSFFHFFFGYFLRDMSCAFWTSRKLNVSVNMVSLFI